MTAPENIRAARNAARLTQTELAKLLGVAQPRVVEWETGKIDPAASTYLRILQVCEEASKAPA